MNFQAKSLRPFIGAKDFEISSAFYRTLGFEEVVLWEGFSVFKTGNFAFYLQSAYIKEWIDNTQVFMEVEDTSQLYAQIGAIDISSQFPTAKLMPIREQAWGREFFVQDPSGILWHFGEFF